jgi:hypothetical protein
MGKTTIDEMYLDIEIKNGQLKYRLGLGTYVAGLF